MNKMMKIEKIEINLKDLLHLNDSNQLKTLISRLTNNNHRILKEQKDLVSYCNLLTSDFVKINEKVRYFFKFYFFFEQKTRENLFFQTKNSKFPKRISAFFSKIYKKKQFFKFFIDKMVRKCCRKFTKSGL